jgi:hypothetical protein
VAGGQAPREGFQILAPQAWVRVDPRARMLICRDTLTLRRGEGGGEELRLGLPPVFAIQEATVDGVPREVRRQGSTLLIEDIPPDTLIRVSLSYAGQMPARSEFSGLTDSSAILRAEDILPVGTPGGLRSLGLRVTVPARWQVATVGRLIERVSDGDTASYLFRLEGEVPMIGWICARAFYEREGVGGDVPVSVALFGEDSSSSERVLPLARDVLRFYSTRFARYRFPVLRIVEIEDWVAGGNVLAIATPTMIMVKKLAFTTGDGFNQVQSILPHEIAHQWWPNTVFVDEEDAAFLSEGMCEYSSVLFQRAHGTTTLRDSLDRHPLLRPLLMRVQEGRDLPLRQKVDLRSLPTHYLKASYVHEMLESLLGDSLFGALYREYALRFALRKAHLSDFQALAEELWGRPLGWFFQEWITRGGIPRIRIYNVKTEPQGNGWVTRGRVRLVGYEEFTTPASVGVETAGGFDTACVWLGWGSDSVYRNDVPFTVPSRGKPLRAVFDPDGLLLKMRKLPTKLSDLRDPSDGVMVVGTRAGSRGLAALASRDSAEMAKAGWSLVIKQDTSVTLADLQNERVFLYGKPSANSVAADLEKKFSIFFRGDSVIIDSRSCFDEGLTLVQVRENPYQSLGLLCWIAPLGERADAALLPYDASWILLKGKEQIASGTWDIRDTDLAVELP